MKNKKGFTLVELLAVIAILAILVIIALPNVIGMFNDAKKSSFTTECKRLYKIAEQSFMNDSLYDQKEQVYSRCDGCTNKELDLSGRDTLKYYIKFNKAGKVVEFYATDGDYQFEYEGDNLLITDITYVDTIADLDDSKIIKITDTGREVNEGEEGTSYKFTTSLGSFESGSNVKEAYINVIDDGYTYSYKNASYAFSERGEGAITILRVSFSKFKNNSYIKVYNQSNELLLTVDSSNRPEKRFSLNNNYYIGYLNVDYEIGNYDYHDLRIEASSDLQGNSDAYHIMYTNYLRNITIEGPWIKDVASISKIENLRRSIDDYDISSFVFDSNTNTFNILWREVTDEK